MSYVVFVPEKLCISQPVHYEVGLNPKNLHKIRALYKDFGQNSREMRTFARLLVKICVCQIFLDPIQNCVSARSAHRYFEVLLN